MQKAIIGKKVGMTQIFDANGNVVPVTVVEAGPCSVVMKKTVENDGYEAVQIGYGDLKASKVNKPRKGHFAKGDVAPKKVLREFRFEDISAMNVGDIIKADVFAEGDSVDVRGTSKGKGYAGVIKRYGAQRTPMTHGGGPVHRHAGSMGSTSTPSRIRKGKIGAGQMGGDQVTIENLVIAKVDADINLIAVKGAIPGPNGGVVILRSTAKVLPEKKGDGAGISNNPQKASARVNPQKASARNH